MFDDPKKELRRLDQALRDTEQEQPLEEDWLQEIRELVDDEEQIPIRNHANGYGLEPEPPAPEFFRAVYEYEEPEPEPEPERMADPPQQAKKGPGWLTFLLLLEILGILLVILWWTRWLT